MFAAFPPLVSIFTPQRIMLACMLSLLTQCAEKPVPTAPPAPQHRVDTLRYSQLRPQQAQLRVDLTKQKAQLLNANDEIVLETDISTGRPTHATPTGSFKILEKIENKRSNRYGIYHDAKTGSVLGPSAEQPRPPKGAVLEGYEMPYWMRLTMDGVGMHVGYVVPGQAISYGCIRVPKEAQKLLYEKCRPGTPVTITESPPDPAPLVHDELAPVRPTLLSRLGLRSSSHRAASPSDRLPLP